jgi:rRNA maturation endonuclease Nob1
MEGNSGVVIDANVVIHGRGDLPYDNVVTSERVYSEILSEMGKYKLEGPDLSSFKADSDLFSEVRLRADENGLSVSDADCSIVALGLERDLLVISDDKGVQNLCMFFSVDFDSFLGDKIEEEMVFDTVCDNCGRSVDGSLDSCGFCGHSKFVRKRDS